MLFANAANLAFTTMSIGSILTAVISFCGYIVRSIFSYKFAKMKNVSYPFISWIPVLYPYNYFEIMDGDSFDFLGLFSGDKKILSVFYIVGGVIVSLSNYIAGWLFLILSLVYLLLIPFKMRNTSMTCAPIRLFPSTKG